MNKIKESDLYKPIADYLASLGYQVQAEVRNCDIAAIKDDELIIVEMKTGFTITLLYQGMERKRIADSVYLAIPLLKNGYNNSHYHDIIRLCKQLEVGLIFVGFTTKGIPQIDVAVHPTPHSAVYKNKKERYAVISEHQNRNSSVNIGGVTRKKIITVYKEQALEIAAILKKHGPLKAAEVRTLSGFEKSSSILSKNFYKWYKKADDCGNRNTTYKITSEGENALAEYQDLLSKSF